MGDPEQISAFAIYGANKKKPAKKSKSPQHTPNKGSGNAGNQSRKSAEKSTPSQQQITPGSGQKLSKRQKRKLKETTPNTSATNGYDIESPTSPKSLKKRKNEGSSPGSLKPQPIQAWEIEETIVDTSVEVAVPFELKSTPTPKKERRGKRKPAKDEAPPTADSPPNDPPTNDSVEDGRQFFRWLIQPIDSDQFFEEFWEKKPCLIQRNDSDYFAKLISCAAIDQMLLKNHVEFTKNIDITSYVDGVRETLNPDGRAMPPVVWGHYEDGCSIRLLNPQTFIQPVYVLNATLQEFFHCMVGTNVYLTPPNSQGFAPHYDDIEAFVMQIEGEKRWKLYNPRTRNEYLARFSSTNFSQDEIGEPILDVVLKPGDMLYFPRGTIHQACTQPGHHSLHVTLSLYQKHSYADLFEILLPRMISRAIEEEVILRRGLPLNLWQTMGKVFTNETELAGERTEIQRSCERIIGKILRHADLDDAVDQMAKRFQHDALPPVLTAAERERTVFGAKTTVDAGGRVCYDYEITMDSHVRLLRANILRVVEEEGAVRVYYHVDNSREYHEYEPNFIEVEPESIAVMRHLIKEYPDYVCVSELEAESEDIKVTVVQGLYERGLVMVDEPMGA